MATAAEERFIQWFREVGGELTPKLGLRDFEGMGRGAVALDDIEEDEVLFAIPRNIVLTTATASLPAKLPQEEWAALTGWTSLMLAMMHEYLRGPESPWYAYFQSMPGAGTFDSLMFWSEEELAQLKGSKVVEKVGRKEADESFHELVLPLVRKRSEVFGDATRYTLDLFHHMGSLILSRSFNVEGEEKMRDDDDSDEEEEEEETVDQVAMVPFADALNAKSGASNARLVYEPTTLNMVATARIARGEQILNTYGEPPNSDLLRRYGHVEEDNSADLVEIDLRDVARCAPEHSRADAERRCEWMLDMGLDESFAIDKSLEIPEELICAVRVLHMPAETLQSKYERKEKVPKPAMDTEVATALVQVLKTRLDDYALPGVQEDEVRLANAQGQPLRYKMALMVRIGEQSILKEAALELEQKLAKEQAFQKKRKGDSSAETKPKRKERHR